MDKAAITPALVAELSIQFPDWAHLPVTAVDLDGHDNTTYRLGQDYSVRMPSADAYAAQVEKEHRWLPYLAAHLPLPIPEPVAYGRPSPGFPRPWSIYRWRRGEIALAHRVHDEPAFARDLAAFLTALYGIDPDGGPAAGPHSFGRGGSLAALDAGARQSIAALANELDAGLATAVWEAALATEWRSAPVWVHGDVTNSNLLVTEGRLSAVLDFGCSAVGDPACDLAITWTFFAGAGREAFRDALSLDADTWARGRGWALWKALLTREDCVASGGDDDAQRFGWGRSSKDVIEEVLANP